MATITCPNCGKLIPASSSSCPNCGYQLQLAKAQSSATNPVKNESHARGQQWRARIRKTGRFLKKQVLLILLLLFLLTWLGIHGYKQYQLHLKGVNVQRQLAQAVRSLEHENKGASGTKQKAHGSSHATVKDPKRPILLLHGFGGSYKSEKYLIASLTQTHLAKQQLMVYVDKKSHVHLIGKYQPTATHKMIIPIEIANNRAGEIYYSAMLAKIMPKLNRRYHIKSYDAIGHSMGSYAWIDYFETHLKPTDQIQPHRVVTIAGPFDGIMNKQKPDQPRPDSKVGQLWDDEAGANALGKDGRPQIEHPEYQHLLRYSHRLPKGLEIINIYGNLKDGSDSDGLVTTTSARSLGYLVKTSGVKVEYQEKQVTGPKAQHTLLHFNNLKVNQLIKVFLLQ